MKPVAYVIQESIEHEGNDVIGVRLSKEEAEQFIKNRYPNHVKNTDWDGKWFRAGDDFWADDGPIRVIIEAYLLF